MTLDAFLHEIDAPPRSLTVVNRSAPKPIQRMLETTFDGQPVSIDEEDAPQSDTDMLVLSEETEDGVEVIATSPLEEFMNSILMVNSDLYITGQTDLENFELPSVLTQLDDVPFSLRGYPESDKEKLLLIAISRYIERHAWRSGAGRLRSSFQRLSRINDERGTRTVYESIAEAGVQTHVYGIPDWQPPLEFGLVSHGGYTEDFRDSWFVVYTPPDGDSDGNADNVSSTPDDEPAPTDAARSDDHEVGAPVALLALETEPRRWEGYWTFRPDLVEKIDGYITRNM
ncbi:histidine kinase (plasmid) [Haloferax larsenii]|uniref:Histidine kinase n=1 Tax=Haloferax larsenii TaxID=302484 RepID=A0ABY5RJ03_HALLR|nr:DICT sensory domain-containing protein [Haloferax larsenii]UVE52341.1 histidine kinase [Haloferax larsenii]